MSPTTNYTLLVLTPDDIFTPSDFRKSSLESEKKNSMNTGAVENISQYFSLDNNRVINTGEQIMREHRLSRIDRPEPHFSGMSLFNSDLESQKHNQNNFNQHNEQILMSSSPVLGRLSGIPLGILGEFNTRRNKHATVKVCQVMTFTLPVYRKHKSSSTNLQTIK